MTGRVELELEGRRLSLSNLDKVLWPRLGLTKGWLVDYYTRIAPVLLPHLRGHPLTLHRFPDGVAAAHWYETRAPAHPPWVETATLHMRRTGKVLDVCVLNDLPSLVWAAQIAAVELHPYLGTTDDLDRPRVVVFDLDPGAPATVVDCCRVALRLRALLEGLGLASWAKSSGGAGLHVYVPVNRATSYRHTKAFARALALVLERDHPDAVTSVMARDRRPGKVFVDWGQNDFGKSTVAPYSLRGGGVPTVSIPATWDEVGEARSRAERRPSPSCPTTRSARPTPATSSRPSSPSSSRCPTGWAAPTPEVRTGGRERPGTATCGRGRRCRAWSG